MALFAPVFIVSKPGHGKAILRGQPRARTWPPGRITLSFAGTANGSATPIATDLANTGKAVWERLPPIFPRRSGFASTWRTEQSQRHHRHVRPTRVVRNNPTEGTIIGVEPAKEE